MKPIPTLLLVAVSLLMAGLPLHADDSVFKKATYAHELDENQSPKDTAEFFYPDQTIYLSVELKGRPKAGKVKAAFYFKEQLIAETTLDVEEVNKGVIFSFGQNTYVGFNLKPTSSLPISENYRTEVFFDDKPLGTFPFKVAPPKDAIPSELKGITFAKGVDDNSQPVDDTRDFTQLEKVFMVGSADLGLGSGLEVTWYINGKEDEAGAKSFTMEENKKATPFYFSYFPAGGWPVGSHEAALSINGKEVARGKFNIKADPNMGNTKVDVASVAFFTDDGSGEAGEEVEGFTTKDKALHVKATLKKAAIPLGVKFVWTLVKTDAEENVELVVAEVEEATPNRVLTSTLTAKKGLPAGSYRVDVVQGEKVLGSKEFVVE